MLATGLAACGGGQSTDTDAAPVTPPLPPVTVALTSSAARITSGQSVHLVWTSQNAELCTASGAWSGALETSGERTVGPLTATGTYTITCSNAASGSSSTSVAVAVVAVSDRYAFEVSDNAVNDAAWDSRAQVLYLAVGSDAPVGPNSILAFDPVSGAITADIWAGSEPSSVAISDDGQYLYVGFSGSDVVKRYRLPGLLLEATYPVNSQLRSSHDGKPAFALQMSAAPGAPLTLGVATISYRTLPPTTQLRVFDGASPRTLTSSPYYTFDSYNVAWSDDSGTLFTSVFGGAVNRLALTTPYAQVSAASQPSGTISADTVYWTAYDGSRVYDSLGGVFDATTLERIATLPTSGTVTVDRANRQFFVVSLGDSGNAVITAYDLDTLAPRETIDVQREDIENQISIVPGLVRRMVRFGDDGLALVGASGRLTTLRGPFVAPGGRTAPIASIPTDACCQAHVVRYTPTMTPTAVVANDIVWDKTHGLLLASISMEAPEYPSTIAVIDPSTAAVVSHVPTEPEPGALAVSDGGQYLYVATSRKLQRFRLPSLALEATADLPGNDSTPPVAGSAPKSLAARPGDPATVAIDGVFLMRDMALLSGAGDSASWSRWSEDGGALYGFNAQSTGMTLWRWPFNSSSAVTQLGSPFDYAFPVNAGYPFDITFAVGGGLLYADTGAVFDPATGGWPGTLPLARLSGISNPLDNSFALASLSIEPDRRRAYAAVCEAYAVQAYCGNSLVSFDLDTYLPVATGEMPSVQGWAYRIEHIDAQTFAILQADRRVVLVSAPELQY
ncbi:MAG: hypothetical protein JWQ90_2539 [Hydrocarboniphaga sp.]|nr:hypothetical protein [Hydrocarboniphaga sp.]